MNATISESIRVTKMVHGGQGLGELADGKKVFIWNALPGEQVRARIIKQRRTYAEAIAEDVELVSPERIAPKEANYLATSPWQMMTFAAENKYKREIVEDLMRQQGIVLPSIAETIHDGRMYHYRNKMEYSFWGDDDGLHLALHQRGSHGKQIVSGSALAMPALDMAAESLRGALDQLGCRAGDLKTVIVRCDQQGEVTASLFVKTMTFPEMQLPKGVKGLRIYYSNPKSPASVLTELLREYGDCHLVDNLLHKPFTYDTDSFFQVNLPVFEEALQAVAGATPEGDLVDMYAGVGSIGLSVARQKVELVELDKATAAMARVNAQAAQPEAHVVETASEKSLDYIVADKVIIFDPPRAGLHDKVVDRVLEALPDRIIYLSCNPATQARDLARLQESYVVASMSVYNFFPRTPHIECLAVLDRKS
jgi:23S rRNA (uracil1939-C5)-methyltransferase